MYNLKRVIIPNIHIITIQIRSIYTERSEVLPPSEARPAKNRLYMSSSSNFGNLNLDQSKEIEEEIRASTQ